MCYICAPNQYKFYGKERLTVCVQFCDQMYEACAHAILKGYRINEIYSNGSEFCQSRRYNVDYKLKDNCFHYVADQNRESILISSSFVHKSTIRLNVLLYLVYFIT